MRKLLLGVLAVLALVPASASAFTVQEVGGLNSPAAGIALGPDGNVWAAEEAAEALVRVSPSGQILGHFPVGGEPLGVAAGPGGRVWTTVANSHKLAWVDATSSSPSVHSVDTGSAKCPPVAIADGGNGVMYFTMPSEGSPCTSELGHVNADGIGEVSTTPSPAGNSFDLLGSGGKLFASSYEDDAVWRLGLPSLSPEAEIAMPAGSGPSRLAADGAGNIWVPLFNSGQLAHFPAAAGSGTAPTVLTPTGGSLVEPFGIVAGADGKLYVPSENAQLLSADATPSFEFSPLPADSEPWDIANGPDGDLWITDFSNTRLLHLFNPAPPAPTTGPTTTSPPPKLAPRLSLSGKSKQKLGGFVQLQVSCPTGPCTISASGTLTVKAGGKGTTTHPKLKAATVQASAGKPTVLKLKIPPKAKRAAAQALGEKGGKASAKITIEAKDAGGTSPVGAFKVKLKK